MQNLNINQGRCKYSFYGYAIKPYKEEGTFQYLNKKLG